MANAQVSCKIWQPWLAKQSAETVDDLVPDDQSLHSKILQTIDKIDSNFKNKKQKDLPYWLLKTECLEKERQMETKPFSLLHENKETGRSVCQYTKGKQSTSCRNCWGIILREENCKKKTDNKILETCSSRHSKPSMSSGAICTDYVPGFLTTYEMDLNQNLLKEISTESDIFGHALNNSRAIGIQQGSSNYIKSTQSTDENSNNLKSPNKGRLCKCKFCDKTAITKYNLEGHLARHSVERPLKCDVSFKFQKNHHNCKLHNGTNKCDAWDKTFVIGDYLVEHRTRIDINPHKCMVCNKTFSSRRNLNRHMRTHTFEKPHQCTICSKTFAEKRYLSQHMVTHTGEKLHQCTVCYKEFARKHYLNLHMRTHTGEKPYLCTVCDKKFTVGCNLFRHMRIHTGEKPHQCTVSNKTFTTRQILNRHRTTHRK